MLKGRKKRRGEQKQTQGGGNGNRENQRKEKRKKKAHVGSLAKFRKRVTRSMEPFSSKSCLKKRAVSMLT